MAGAERVPGSVARVPSRVCLRLGQGLDLKIDLKIAHFFQQQRSTYLLKMAAFLGVSMSRLSLEPEAANGRG